MEILPVSYCHPFWFSNSNNTDASFFFSISQECLKLPGVCRKLSVYQTLHKDDAVGAKSQHFPQAITNVHYLSQL